MKNYYEDADRSGKLGDMLASIQQAARNFSDVDWQIKTLYAIKKWALEQQAVKAGDRVRIRDSYDVGPRVWKDRDGYTNGYYPYRECLAPGKTGTVKSVEFNAVYGTWSAWVVMDEQWSVAEPRGGDSEPLRYPTKPEHRSPFGIRPQHLEVIKSERAKPEPCEKCGRAA